METHTSTGKAFILLIYTHSENKGTAIYMSIDNKSHLESRVLRNRL